MTRKQLRKTIIGVIVAYVVVLCIGFAIYYLDTTAKKENYQVFKDLIPLMITISAAYLGFCFQRRSSFLQALRQVWTNLIRSVSLAIQYTHLSEPSEKQYAEVLVLLSQSIDEIRSVYKNLKETDESVGHYPFESLKEIYKLVATLGFGPRDNAQSREARRHIRHNWVNLRGSFLTEFDRSEPTVYDSPYVKK